MFVEFYVVVLYFNAVLFEVFCRFIEFVSNNKSELLMNNLLVNESSLNRIMGKRISLSTTCVLYSLGKLLLYCLHLLACSLSLSRLGPLLSSALGSQRVCPAALPGGCQRQYGRGQKGQPDCRLLQNRRSTYATCLTFSRNRDVIL